MKLNLSNFVYYIILIEKCQYEFANLFFGLHIAKMRQEHLPHFLTIFIAAAKLYLQDAINAEVTEITSSADWD